MNPAQEILNITASHALDALPVDNVNGDKMKAAAVMLKEKARVEKQLADLQKKKADSQIELEKLRGERAKITLSNKNGKLDKELSQLNNKIAQLNFDIDAGPDVVKVLETSLAAATAKIAAENRDATLDAQKAAAKQCQDLSEKLVKQLEVANGTNEVLSACYLRYQNLAKETGVDVLTARFAEPSRGMLDFLYGHLKGELKDGKHCRSIPRDGPQI